MAEAVKVLDAHESENLVQFLAEQTGNLPEHYEGMEWELRIIPLDSIVVDEKFLPEMPLDNVPDTRYPLILIHSNCFLADGYHRYVQLKEDGAKDALVFHGRVPGKQQAWDPKSKQLVDAGWYSRQELVRSFQGRN
ncbi:hypothetical protein ACFL1B_04510 [Nanoarchaeota archaeon]